MRQPLIGLVGPVHRVTVTLMDFREDPNARLDIAIGPPPDPVAWSPRSGLGVLVVRSGMEAQATELPPATFGTRPGWTPGAVGARNRMGRFLRGSTPEPYRAYGAAGFHSAGAGSAVSRSLIAVRTSDATAGE